MKIPAELTDIFEKIVNEEVAKRIKEYPVYVRIDGDLVDSCSVIEGGQIEVNIETPIFFPGSDEKCFLAYEEDSF